MTTGIDSSPGIILVEAMLAVVELNPENMSAAIALAGDHRAARQSGDSLMNSQFYANKTLQIQKKFCNKIFTRFLQFLKKLDIK